MAECDEEGGGGMKNDSADESSAVAADEGCGADIDAGVGRGDTWFDTEGDAERDASEVCMLVAEKETSVITTDEPASADERRRCDCNDVIHSDMCSWSDGESILVCCWAEFV
jgi:hypothetical protein